MPVEEYANRLFNAWGIGKRETNNGVLLLVAPNERRARIEAGTGLEPILTDGICGGILDEKVIPRFREGDNSGGIIAGADEIARILRENPAAAHGIAGSGPRVFRRPWWAPLGEVVALLDLRILLLAAIAATILYPMLLIAIAFWAKNAERYPSVLYYGGLLLGVGPVLLAPPAVLSAIFSAPLAAFGIAAYYIWAFFLFQPTPIPPLWPAQLPQMRGPPCPSR